MRYENNASYWDRRWSEADPDAGFFRDLSIYPVKYSEMVVKKRNSLIAELGCGLGRILNHYNGQGYNIIGIERSDVAVKKIKENNKAIKVLVSDVRYLPFKDESLEAILAFGLYHNIEYGFMDALRESIRCLKAGGNFCISIRPDNLEMRLNEYYWLFKRHREKNSGKHFHKWLIKEGEFKAMLKEVGCEVEQIFRARNVSILWRVPFLKYRDKKEESPQSSESKLRSGGYRLNSVGKVMDYLLTKLFPSSFCNVLVFIGRKI